MRGDKYNQERTNMAQQSPSRPNIAPQNDLYTLLLIIAATLLLTGIIFILFRSAQLFDWPWASSGA